MAITMIPARRVRSLLSREIGSWLLPVQVISS